MSYVVGPKGQIVVAKDIREHLGVESGWIALQRLAGDHLEVYFVPPEHRRSLKGSLAPHMTGEVSTDEWDEVREGAWKRAARIRESRKA